MATLARGVRSTGAGILRGASRQRMVVRVSAFRLISRPNVGDTPSWPKRTGLANVLARAEPAAPSPTLDVSGKLTFHGVHHVALICANLERSLEFYQGVLGLQLNADRPDHKLPYRGAWLWIGPEMIHLMELPNPDPADSSKRPEHGGRDRHFCIGVANLEALATKLDSAGIPFTRSMSGRAAVFFRDPDANCLECVELSPLTDRAGWSA